MKNKRFQTDLRVWFWVAVSLFVVGWCFPLASYDNHSASFYYIAIDKIVFTEFSRDSVLFRQDVIFVLGLAGIVAVVSVLAGWLIQCFIVIIRDRNKRYEIPVA
jgi:hypothetical protein